MSAGRKSQVQGGIDFLRKSKKILDKKSPVYIIGAIQDSTAFSDAEVAQSVEQRTENPRVHSSILCLGIYAVDLRDRAW